MTLCLLYLLTPIRCLFYAFNSSHPITTPQQLLVDHLLLKTLDNAGSLSHENEALSSGCVFSVQTNTHQLEVGKRTDLRAIVIVPVP